MMFAAVLILGTTQPTPAPIGLATSAVIDYLKPIAFAAAPTGSQVLVCTEDGAVRIIDGKTHQTVRTFERHKQPAYAAAWSRDGKTIATGDETARIFIESAATGKKIREYRTHTKGIQKLSFNTTGRFLISTGKDDQINIYDLTSPLPKEARKIMGNGANFYGATFSPMMPNTISTGVLGNGGRCYDCLSCKQNGILATGDPQGVFDVCYNPAGTREVTAGKCGEADVFDTKTMKKIGALKGHQDFVMCAGFSPNGNLIATASTDRTVKLWNASTFERVAEIGGQDTVGSPLCFTADGQSLITVNDQGYMQFNTITPNQAAEVVKAQVAKPTKTKRHRHRIAA